MAELSKDKFRIVGCENVDADEILRPNMTYWQDAWRRLKQNRVALTSLIILILIALFTIFGPMISPFKFEETNTDIVNQGMSSVHWFGTDVLGRDLFTRVSIGGRVSMIIALVGAVIDTAVGVLYGGVAGYFGGFVDDIMMRIIEILGSIPYLIVVILISLILTNGGIIPILVAMCFVGWTGMARLIRGQILQIKEQEYVLAAQALGANSNRIILRHLIPNTVGVMIVSITFDIPSFIFGEAWLSFIGLGIKSPQTSWGALASSGQQNLMFYPTQLIFPSLFISLTMLSFNLLGDGLRDALDPRLRQ